MRITRNKITENIGTYMVEFKANSQSEILGELRASFFENSLRTNSPHGPEVGNECWKHFIKFISKTIQF